MYLRGQVPETFFYCIESRKGAEQRKVRRPNVRGDKHRIGAHVERDRKQVFGRKPQDRPPVRTDVADRFQLEGEPFCGVPIRISIEKP